MSTLSLVASNSSTCRSLPTTDCLTRGDDAVCLYSFEILRVIRRGCFDLVERSESCKLSCHYMCGLGYLLKSPCDFGVQKERVNERDELRPVNDVSRCAEEPDHWRIAGVARSGRPYLCCLWEPLVFPCLSRERRRPEWNPCWPVQQLPHASKVDSNRNRRGKPSLNWRIMSKNDKRRRQ